MNENDKKISKKIFGIDLGTTNSCIAVMEGKTPRVFENPEGSRTTPSVVSFDKKEGRFLKGIVAKRQAARNPETVFSIKRKMGTKEKVRLGGKDMTPEQISAEILRYLVDYASDKEGEKVKRVVITVPAYFDDNQRQATKNAGEIAGLEVENIINEPTAAALAYGFDRSEREQKILVYDLGGGTFDVSVLQISKGAKEGGVFEVLAVAGINTLGGDNFDKRIFDYVVKEFRAETGINLLVEGDNEKEKRIIERQLEEACEKAKVELSTKAEADVTALHLISPKGGREPHLDMKITRAEFENLTKDYMEKTMEQVDIALRGAEEKIGEKVEIDQIILVGGSTRMPMVEKELKKKFPKKEISKSVNPDEAVAIGAAIKGAILTGDIKDILLLDVTPLSLGIETEGGIMDFIIKSNTTIPTQSEEKIYSTATDNQTSVHIRVLQGERTRTMDNKLLATFELTGIEPAPRGVPQIGVNFEIDSNGILKVSATDKKSKKQKSLTVDTKQGLSEAEIEKMKREAEENRSKDEEFKSNAELYNQAQSYCYSFERQLEEFKKHKNFKEDDPQFQEFKKLYEELKEATKEAKEAKEDEKREKYSVLKEKVNKVTELMELAQKLAQKMPKEEEKKEDEGYASGNEEEVLDVQSEKKDDNDDKNN